MNLSSSLSIINSVPTIAVRIVPKLAADAMRRPFHLTLLLDTSGSMDGARITAVKRTLHLLIDAMMDSDVLSIIGYSNVANVLSKATILTAASKLILHTTVDSMVAGGGTNLECALLAITSLVSDIVKPIDAVFILTDGQINCGVESPSGLQRIIGSVVPLGTPINMLGFGSDHNASLLRDIALRSRGSYTYADADEMIPAIIGDITGGLENEVGRNGVLPIPAGWRCVELGCAEDDTEYTVGTLISEKEQWVVLAAKTADAPIPATIRFGWNGACFAACSLDYSITADEIVEQYERTRVALAFMEVSRLIEIYDIERARTILKELSTELSTCKAAHRSFVIRLHAQVDEMLDALTGFGTATATSFPAFAAFGAIPPPPGTAGYQLAPLLSRMASNTSALGAQRGFLSHIISNTSDAVDHSFSSPQQRVTSRAISSNYSQEAP